MATTTNETWYRETYKNIARAVCAARGLTAAEFNDLAASGAHEHADGEERTAGDWVMGARYVAEDLGVDVRGI